MLRDFLYRFLSSSIAVGVTVVLFLLLTAGVLFRIIPWWLYLLLLLVCIVGVVGYAIVSELLAIKRDRAFVDGMREQGETRIGKEKARDRDSAREMHERWLAGFQQLQSTLGKKGGRRAVYHLPWYLIIGKPATGKTTAIRNAGLHFAVSSPKLTGTGGTRNCDWFFTEEAVLLDTAGRYTVSSEVESDKLEWGQFLGLLRKYRPDMPINGLMVAVATDDLLGREREDVIADARELRSRLDELMTELGIHFPVYMLVTKCDLIQGFTEFFGRLEKSRLTELLGWTNPTFDVDDLEKTIDEAFSKLGERFKRMRPEMLRDESDPAAQRNVFLFPEELVQATKMLAQYCDVLFRPSKYSDSPFLRGIYFNSAMQTGNTVSHILGRLGLTAQPGRVQQGNRSFFLQDFFEKRLAADQRLVVPTGRTTMRLRVFNNVGLAVVAAVCVVVALVSTTSYVRNRRLLLDVEDAVAQTAEIQGKQPAEQMALLEQYREAVEELRSRNLKPSWLERFGLYTGEALEAPTVERFLGIYEAVAYKPSIDGALAGLQRTEDPGRAFGALDTLINHLVTSKQARSSQVETGGESLAAWWPNFPADDSEARERFAKSYRFYLREPWRFGAAAHLQTKAERERTDLVATVGDKLPLLLTVGTVTRWLENGEEIRASSISGYSGGTAKVRPAFTPKSWRERVIPLFAALEQVQDEVGAGPAKRLAADYSSAYFQEWYGFLLSLNDTVVLCDLQRAPYFAALDMVYENTTTPFQVKDGAKKDAPAKDPAAAEPEQYLPGFEPPPWVRAAGQVGRERKQYVEKISQPCLAVGSDDPCEVAQKLVGGGGGMATVPVAQLRSWVRDGLVGVSYATDADDQRLREQMNRLLASPLERAGEGARGACEARMRSTVKGALAGVSFKGPWELSTLERVAPQVGAVWQACEEALSPFFNCAALTPKPNAAVPVPSDIVSLLRQANRMAGVFFDASGGLRSHTIEFDSVPTTSDRGASVAKTTLKAACKPPWELSHRQIRVADSLSWRPGECVGATLQVELDGGRIIEMSRKGNFAIFELLADAKVSGNEYSWRFPQDGVVVTYAVSLPDAKLLDYFR